MITRCFNCNLFALAFSFLSGVGANERREEFEYLLIYDAYVSFLL